ncbi:hypothetical protein TcYC6_0007020 [Trypanosoma cruzi]|nr:hypothetical protein TcYC6_0007020 [Trypanosoma cruzi]
MQGCQRLRGEAPQGARLSGESSGSAADPHTWPQRGAGRFNGRSSDTVQGVPGVPWLEYAHPVAAHSAPDNNAVLSMRGADVVRGDPHVATDASQSVEDGISRQRNGRRCLPMY